MSFRSVFVILSLIVVLALLPGQACSSTGGMYLVIHEGPQPNPEETKMTSGSMSEQTELEITPPPLCPLFLDKSSVQCICTCEEDSKVIRYINHISNHQPNHCIQY
ncbi:hypothetical protein POX_f07960 [Penicillium oxalicum]|uniref:hypothetical protein n=1 Tax=Penicillium oxalicum TaxID=69781 RepID=UPI0020B8C529|nr:hypothetical protein POX_f07960 [Penicillium oxalicum]KAI2787588.1 hypothetical protein POX_f07960 [Penicillium oxalicum]